MIKSALQGIALFVGIQFVMGQFMGKKGPDAVTNESGVVVNLPPNTAPIPPFLARPDTLAKGAVYNPIPQRIAPIWPMDSPLDLTIVISPSFVSEALAKVKKDRKVVEETAFIIGNFKENRVIDTEFEVPKEVQNNGTLWAHFYIGLTGSKLDPTLAGYDTSKAFHFIHPLTQYITQKKVKKTKNLLATKSADDEEVCAYPVQTIFRTNFYRPRKKFQLGQLSPLITTRTLRSHSSLIPESCYIHPFIQLSANTSIQKPPGREMRLVKMDGTTQYYSSTRFGSLRLT